MKDLIKTILVICAGVLLVSCTSYLDINNINPNQATSSKPNLLLSSALVGTASMLEQYNSYGMETAGYGANAGGYGGFNEFFTYQYTNNTFTGLWSNTYQNLINYQQIIDIAKADTLHRYNTYEAIAMIMMAHDYQLLIDQYNDVPYTNALRGLANLTPSYDQAPVIYAKLAAKLDSAIAKIHGTFKITPSPIAVTSEDVVFKGDTVKWLQLANTLKLKLMVRGRGKVTFTNTSFDPAGFLTKDALINPGYRNDNGRQNPKWGNWAWDYAGNAINKAWMPSIYVLGFYDGNKIVDDWRGAATYFNYSSGTAKISNQLGFEDTSVPSCPEGTFWYSGSDRAPVSAGNSQGAMKGPDASYPLITAAECNFLRAEAALVGIATPGALTDAQYFKNGITSSFEYLYSLPNGSQPSGSDYAADAASYYDPIGVNEGNYLVDYGSAASLDQKLEAIITQKYIALNFIHSHEGWNEYRRTHYPIVIPGDELTSFASRKSQSTRADKLPTRLLYPVSEARYNPINVPKNISQFTSLIFWAQ
ncbi:MAG: SusD/RagB family nutrient-binding outer membrane lipoprotein [Cyclobacteriaceae bacterium]